MKKMKKLGMFLSVFIIIAMLAACGSNETSKGEGNSKETNSGDSKTLRIVTNANFAPMEYLDGDKVLGFDVDFVKAVAEEAGYEAKVEHVGWDALFIEVEGKTADLGVAAITINDDRKQTYDFSVPYYASNIQILVPENSEIKTAQDIKGKVVSVQNGTTGMDAAEAIIGKGSPDIKKFEDNNLAIQEMLNGGADAVLADKPVVEEYVKNNPDQKLKVVDDASFEQEYYGIIFTKGSKLKEEFDKAINAIYDNGKYAEIYKEWFGTEPDIEHLKGLQ